ncbi:hypothetical protein [Microbacterium hydrothermale]|uniref:hypothetical protein n=1 Tax=Microbacterium hydrothermale TaxID=857427 RepID=UPI0022275CB1|nr:hypothetical protein [Microbacterium hydrothermale]
MTADQPAPFTPKLTPHPSVFPGRFGLPESPEPSRLGLGVGHHAGAAWVTADPHATARLHMDGILIAAPPTSRHILVEGDRVVIEHVTMFPGSLTHREAFVWAIRPVLSYPHVIRYRLARRAWQLIYAAQDRFRRLRALISKGAQK